MDEIRCADSLQELQDLDEKSVHAIVTDPPYGLAFMGRSWDDFEPKEYQEWCEKWARRAKRVLKPGGHLLAFSGNRTHHRLFTGVEDAGFEIRDTLTWHYGSGFPKASDISKTIDKREGAEREVVGEYVAPDGEPRKQDLSIQGGNYANPENNGRIGETKVETEPGTEKAEKWDGWKTGLKPATEYVVMARKPFDGTTVDCVLEHGTGALNIEDTRIGTDGRPNIQAGTETHDQNMWDETSTIGNGSKSNGETTKGRYPSNVVFDEIEAERLDERNDETSSTVTHSEPCESGDRMGGGDLPERTGGVNDSGGISRYFYTSKANKSERNLDGRIDNSHPTVKPQDLMEWLIKLVTREDQTVLDPFCGSGTTCKAAKELNRRFIGIEKQEQWADVARVRCNLTPEDPSIVRNGENHGLEAFE
jgi:site-specific DNA-methyltransferase (adenine-specific)